MAIALDGTLASAVKFTSPSVFVSLRSLRFKKGSSGQSAVFIHEQVHFAAAAGGWLWERLLQIHFAVTMACMSMVELAVRKVKQLSGRQARELLSWLDARQTHGIARRSQAAQRKSAARRRRKNLMAWHDSVRGTTDWEPPRMPDDLVKPFRL